MHDITEQRVTAIDEFSPLGNPQQLARLHPVQFAVRPELEAALYDEDHFVIEQRPGDLGTLPSREADAHVWRDFVADGAGDTGASRWPTAMGEIQVAVIDQQHRTL